MVDRNKRMAEVIRPHHIRQLGKSEDKESLISTKILHRLKHNHNIQQKIDQLKYYFEQESYEYGDIVSDLNEKKEESLIYEFCQNELNDIAIYNILYNMIMNVNINHQPQNNDNPHNPINITHNDWKFDVNENVSENKDNNETKQFKITWYHIINATIQELYKEFGNVIREIIRNEENEIKQSDLSEETVDKVLNLLVEKQKSLSKDEYLYIKQLVDRAKSFDPFISLPPIIYRIFPFRCDFDENGLFYLLKKK
eukprot:430386_1